MKTKHLSLLGLAFSVFSLGACAPANVSDANDKEASDAELIAADLDTPARMEAQLRVAPQATRVEARAATADHGFANVAEDSDHDSVIVYRVGGDEPSVRATLQAELGAGTQLVIKPALLSQGEANDLTAKLDSEHEAIQQADFTVSSWGPSFEGGPFVVGVHGNLAKAKAQLEAKYPNYKGRLEVEDSLIVPYTRMNDSAPYRGGDRLVSLAANPNYVDQCSSGWGAVNTHGQYLITASHCDCNANTRVVNGDGSKLVGNYVALDKAYDAVFVKTSLVTASTWAGSHASPNSTVAFVDASGHPHAGQYICTSGSFSDLRCSGKVGGWKHVSIATCNGTITVPEWYADQIHHLSLAGEGDSGGPVFVRDSATQVQARGIISAGDTTKLAACAEGGNKRKCAWRVFFPDIITIANRHSLSLQGF